MNLITDILSYEFNQRALLVAVMIGFMNGYVGGYVVLRRGALFASSLSHTLFPGVALGALIAGINPYSALIGAFVMAMVIGLGSEGIAANSRIDRDASMAVLVTAGMAAGLLLLRRVATNIRIEDYLFGNILGVADWDLWFVFMAGGVVLSALILFQRPLQIHVFSPELAASQGLSVSLLDYLMSAAVVITMVASLQAVGTLLAIGLLVAPAATMYLYLDSTGVILWGGGVLGVLIAVATVIISNVVNIPTGPAMMILLASVFVAGFALSPRYGLLAALRTRHAPDH
ncbi:MAG: metal ABC transporter permease [Lentisphaerae bacterium]|nr:metal ABC transporter permease [Lentisphaerota bacterium]